MAQKTEPLAHADELAELWSNLLPRERQALLTLSYRDPALQPRTWHELDVDSRMQIVRAMRGLTELAVDCAVVLERAKAALDRAAPPTPREELVNKLADIIGLPPERLEYHLRKKGD
jgi:hypothetical protein